MDVEPQSFDRVLSSMCTLPHPVAREAAERFLATNPGDPGTYPAVTELESRVVDLLGEVTGLAAPEGYVASGGTEANLQAVRIARELGPADPNVVVPESAHFSFHKAADVLDVELRVAPVDGDRRVRVDGVQELVDDRTAAVVGVAGTTEYGRVDPVPALADVVEGRDALLHVDAAYGGFELPYTDHEWRFDHAVVDTMTIDPHKRGRAAIPAGGLLARAPEYLDALAIDTPYLESRSQVTLTGTRSGAGVASAYAALEELWPDGYREDAERSMANATWLADALADRDIDVVDPELSVVAADVDRGTFERLREEGWRISRTEAGEVRVVCMPHVTREMLESFVADLDRVRTVDPDPTASPGT